jgi:hypothetical protein
MGKFFFPAVGVGFSELRQIALTFCHRIVRDPREQFVKVMRTICDSLRTICDSLRTICDIPEAPERASTEGQLLTNAGGSNYVLSGN